MGFYQDDWQRVYPLYGPEGVGKQPDPNARTKADTWTREFYI